MRAWLALTYSAPSRRHLHDVDRRGRSDVSLQLQYGLSTGIAAHRGRSNQAQSGQQVACEQVKAGSS